MVREERPQHDDGHQLYSESSRSNQLCFFGTEVEKKQQHRHSWVYCGGATNTSGTNRLSVSLSFAGVDATPPPWFSTNDPRVYRTTVVRFFYALYLVDLSTRPVFR